MSELASQRAQRLMLRLITRMEGITLLHEKSPISSRSDRQSIYKSAAKHVQFTTSVADNDHVSFKRWQQKA